MGRPIRGRHGDEHVRDVGMTERLRYQLPDRNLGLDLMRVTEAVA